MAGDINELIRLFKSQIQEDSGRLADLTNEEEEKIHQIKTCDNEHQQNNNVPSPENKENLPLNHNSSPVNQNLPLIERLDLSSNEGALEETKRAFVAISPNASGGRKMLRYGEYSPNNPQLRVSAAPYLGLGEYEQRRNLLQERRRADYLEHLSKSERNFKNCLLTGNVVTRAVQTDLQNIHCPLVQYETYTPEKELNSYISSSVMQNSRNLSPYRADQRLTSQNALLKPEMDKPKSILSNRRTGSPRERLLSDLKHSYSPSFLDGFSYQDRAEELERERIKRDNYQRELRLQIEEKRHLQAMREEQERREQELENKRLEQQLLRMQEEQAIEEQRRCRRDEQMRRHSEDLLRRKHELQSRLRKHTESESSVSSLRNTNVASKTLSHYSPPVSRRNPYSFNIPSTSVFADMSSGSSSRYNPNRFDSYYRKDALNRMDSLNTYDTHRRYNAFSRFDSLSRIDSLNRQDTLNRLETLSIQDRLSNVQRRHSATQQDLSLIRRSPKLQRRSSSSRFEDTLPIPVLKAHSPVAKELKNSVPFNSSRSDAVRKLEDKWQIPAVQKNIVNHGDPLRDGQGRSILTQLGAIRMQLQKEQLRMDETLRKRGITQSKAVDFFVRMDNKKWNTVLIEWVNCLKLCKNINKLDELRDGEFFSNLQKVISKSRDAQVAQDVLTFIFDLFGRHYPNYLFHNKTEIHLFDLPEIDLKAIISLLMHYTCIYDRRDVLTSPLCHSLSQSTQLIIRNFLQKTTTSVNKESMSDIIKSCIDDASDHLITNQWLSVETSCSSNSPLQDILKTPISKFGRLHEKDKIISKLKSEIEAERYEKADLQEELKLQLEKSKKIEQQLQQKNNEISRLRAEVGALENRTPPNFQDMDSRELQRRLRSEIQTLEQYIKQIEDEQDEIKKEKDATKERLRKIEQQANIWEEKFFETERNFENLTEHSKQQEKELREMQAHCAELTALLEEYRENPKNDSSLFEFSTEKPLNETELCPEDLACSVIEVQLRDAQKQIEELKKQIGETEECVTQLRNVLLETETKLKHSEDLNTEFETKVKSLENDKETAQTQLTLTQSLLDEANKNSNVLETKVKNVETKLQETDEVLETLRGDKEELLAEVNSLQLHIAQVEKQLAEALDELEDNKKQSQSLENQLTESKAVSEKLQFELADVLLDNQKTHTILNELYNEKNELVSKLDEAENTKTSLEKHLFEFQDYSKNLASECETLRVENLAFKQELSNKNTQLLIVSQEKSDLTIKLEYKDEKIVDLEKTNEKLNSEMDILQNQLKETLDRLDSSQSYSQKLQFDYSELEKKLHDTKTHLENLTVEVNMVLGEKQAVDEQLVKREDYITRLEEEKNILYEKTNVLEDSYRKLTQKSEELQSYNEDVLKQLSDVSQTLEMTKQEIGRLQELQKSLELQLEKSQICSETLKVELEQMQSVNNKTNYLLQETEAALDQSKQENKILKIQIETLQQELDDSNNNLIVSQKNVSELKETKSGLEEDLKQVVLESEYLKSESEKIKLEKSTNDKELNEVKKALTELEEESKKKKHQFENEIVEVQKHLNDALTSLETVRKEEEKLKNSKNHLESKLREAQTVEEKLKLEVEKLTNDLSESREERSDFLKKLENLEEENGKLIKESQDLQKHLSQALIDLESKTAESKQLNDIQIALETRLDEAEKIRLQLETIQSHLDETQNSYEELKKEKSLLESEYKNMRQLTNEFEGKLNEDQDYIKALEMKNEDIDKQLEDTKKVVIKLEGENGALMVKMRILEQEKEELCDEKKGLERELFDEKSNFEEMKTVTLNLQTNLEDLHILVETVRSEKEKLNEVLMNERNENEALVTKLNEKCELLEDKLTDYVDDLETSNKELERVKEEKSLIEIALENLRCEVQSAEKFQKVLKNEKEALETALQQVGVQLNELKNKNEILQREILEKTDAFEINQESFTKEKEKLELEVEKLSKTNKDIQNQLFVLERNYKESRNDKEILDKQLNEMGVLSETLKAESENLRIQYQKSKIELEETGAMLMKATSEKENLFRLLQHAKEQNGEFERQISVMNNTLELKENECNELKDAIKKLVNEKDDLFSVNESLQKRITEIEDENKEKEIKERKESEQFREELKRISEEKLLLKNKLEDDEVMSLENQKKIKSLEETIQDYEITISGLKNVVDTNLESLETLKEELADGKIKESEIMTKIYELLKTNNLNGDKAVQGDFKTFIFENFKKLLFAKHQEEQRRKDLKVEIEELKAKNMAATKLNTNFQEMVEKLQALVMEQSEVVTMDALKLSFDQIHSKVNSVLNVKQKLSEDLNKLTNDNSELSRKLDGVLSEKEEIFKLKAVLEKELQEEKEKVENLRKELESKSQPIKVEKENILGVSRKGNKSREDELKKENMMLKRKLVLAENAKNNLEKVLKELREEKKKVREVPSSPTGDALYKKLLHEYIQVKEDNERVVKEKDAKIEELIRRNEELIIKGVPIRQEGDENKNQELQHIREAYGNVMSVNSKLEMEIVTLRKIIEERNNELASFSHIKEAYEKLLEDNNKLMTEIDTMKYKRTRDKEEFVRLIKKERDENSNRETKKIQDIRNEYEGKLEKMKDKMLKLYREEVNKKVRSVKDGQGETATMMKTIANLRSELFEADQKIQLLEMEKEIWKMNRKIDNEAKTKELQQSVSNIVTTVTRTNERASTLPRPSITQEITISRRTSVSGIPNNLQMEDEEDLFNDKYLTDLKEGKCVLPSSRESTNRFSELAWRNSLVPPHLKSSYPAEMQFVSPNRFKDDDIKTGNIEFEDSLCKLLPGEKPRKKDFGTTTYKKPGPPTPSKNGGRLSLQGNEVHPSREPDGKTPKRSTPSRIKALFTGRNNSARDTGESQSVTPSRGRRLNSIFRRPK
ncbi:nucleoporin nup211 [Tribolium madens]|uniref:nucleoporin nup211 n=1 Tax=Tribolium madens TaxID=41895 RepID=UPI001CF7477D|nr:nucleoporin nup211 [Tribolium madens]